LRHKLADHAAMDAPVEIAGREDQAATPRHRHWPRLALRAIGLLALAIIVALAFGAYRQPDLLLNLMGLRYCG